MTHDKTAIRAYKDVVRELGLYNATFISSLTASERRVALSRREMLEEQLHELAQIIVDSGPYETTYSK